jgi:hypothetical protein
MRKQDKDENATNHDNRSLTPPMKQFKSDRKAGKKDSRKVLL